MDSYRFMPIPSSLRLGPRSVEIRCIGVVAELEVAYNNQAAGFPMEPEVLDIMAREEMGGSQKVTTAMEVLLMAMELRMVLLEEMSLLPAHQSYPLEGLEVETSNCMLSISRSMGRFQLMVEMATMVLHHLVELVQEEVVLVEEVQVL